VTTILCVNNNSLTCALTTILLREQKTADALEEVVGALSDMSLLNWLGRFANHCCCGMTF
jgi:hypothetical protein